MGRFEDLVEQAKQGDATALDALESEFAGSTLREKAESAATLEEKLSKGLPLMRKAAFADLAEQLDDELKGSGISAADFGEFDPEDLTLDMVKEKAKSALDAAQESKLALAKESGFDTVEEFETVLKAAKEQKAKTTQEMEGVAGGVASGGGEPSGTQGESLFEIGKVAHDKALQEGKTSDRALGESVAAILEAQGDETPE